MPEMDPSEKAESLPTPTVPAMANLLSSRSEVPVLRLWRDNGLFSTLVNPCSSGSKQSLGRLMVLKISQQHCSVNLLLALELSEVLKGLVF